MYQHFWKRLLDLLLSACALVILSPILLVLAALVRIKLGSPVIFCQERVGKGEHIFKLYKFRTMTDDHDDQGNLLSDELRLTAFGKLLRATSLDELPELFNIFKGDMAIVGPRPLLPSYLPYYTAYEHRRHLVRGGLTPPEVLYQNILPTWEEQFSYEVTYAEHVSLWLDVRIIFATIRGVLQRNKVDYGTYVRKSLIDERTSERKEDRVYGSGQLY